MPARRLSADESALWAKVMASVRPIRAIVTPSGPQAGPAVSDKPIVKAARAKADPAPFALSLSKGSSPPAKRSLSGYGASTGSARTAIDSASNLQSTLDGGWDRSIARGIVTPDSSIDLHGHTLASAHALLDAGLGRAIARGDRVLLLVTGKPPRAESERPHARGAIRSAITDWLAVSRHAGSIAAVRGAHPRHGGTGALYLVLRRPRDPGRNP